MRVDASARSVVLPQLDDAATPTLAFGDGDSGFYENTDDEISVAIAGSFLFRFTAAGFGSLSSGRPFMLNEAVSGTNPVWSFKNDENTGVGRAATDALSLIAGGVELMRLVEAGAGTSSYAWAARGMRIGADSTDNLIDDASVGAASTQLFIGNASIDVTSDERVKSDIVRWQGDALVLLSGLAVREYDYASHEPFGNVYDGRYVGVTAQDVYKVAPWAVNTQGGAGCWSCLNGIQCGEHQNPWTVKAELLMGVVIKGIQELEQENDVLRQRVVILEGR